MEAALLTKPASELTTAELKALLNSKESDDANDRQLKRVAYETLRDDSVVEMVQTALSFQNSLSIFKNDVFSEVDTLYKMLQEHSSRHADGKGNVTLESSSKTHKVQFKRHDNTRFDERATQAEKHIIDFLTAQFGDTSATSKLVRKLLERKKGQLDKNQVLQLISMRDDFDNENWRKGIELLQESIVPAETKYYTQFFVRDTEGDEWKPIVLDFAKMSC